MIHNLPKNVHSSLGVPKSHLTEKVTKDSKNKNKKKQHVLFTISEQRDKGR